MNLSPLYFGAVHDVKIYKDCRTEEFLQKPTPPNSQYPFEKMWVLADGGYRSIEETTNAILPERKPRNSELSIEQKEFNKKLGSARVLIENYFGRMKRKFLAVAGVVRIKQDKLQALVYLAFALTNYDIHNHPLRADKEEESFYEADLSDFRAIYAESHPELFKKYLRKRRLQEERRKRSHQAAEENPDRFDELAIERAIHHVQHAASQPNSPPRQELIAPRMAQPASQKNQIKPRQIRLHENDTLPRNVFDYSQPRLDSPKKQKAKGTAGSKTITNQSIIRNPRSQPLITQEEIPACFSNTSPEANNFEDNETIQDQLPKERKEGRSKSYKIIGRDTYVSDYSDSESQPMIMEKKNKEV